MRIAFYCPNKPLAHPHPSGDLIIAQDIHNALNRLGHECREVTRFRSRWFWRKPGGWAEAIRQVPRSYLQTARFRPDLWLTYHTYYKSPDVLGPWISRLRNIPYVLFQPMYGTRRRRDPNTRVGFYLNRFALTRAEHAFTNNLNDLEALRRIMRKDRIRYLPPGIFPEKFQRDQAAGARIRTAHGIAAETPLLLTVARFRPGVKFASLNYLFRALTRVSEANQPYELLLIGDGPMEEQLRQLARSLLPARTIFTGPVAHEDMAAYYSAADLFVFPGIGESLGMVYLEAQACALPVVALDTAGVPQTVSHNRTGLLVPDDGGAAMAQAILRLVRDRETLARLSANGPKFIHEERNLHRNYQDLASGLEEIWAAFGQ